MHLCAAELAMRHRNVPKAAVDILLKVPDTEHLLALLPFVSESYTDCDENGSKLACVVPLIEEVVPAIFHQCSKKSPDLARAILTHYGDREEFETENLRLTKLFPSLVLEVARVKPSVFLAKSSIEAAKTLCLKTDFSALIRNTVVETADSVWYADALKLIEVAADWKLGEENDIIRTHALSLIDVIASGRLLSDLLLLYTKTLTPFHKDALVRCQPYTISWAKKSNHKRTYPPLPMSLGRCSQKHYVPMWMRS